MFAAKHTCLWLLSVLPCCCQGLRAWLCSRQELSNAPQNLCFGRAGRAPSHPS